MAEPASLNSCATGKDAIERGDVVGAKKTVDEKTDDSGETVDSEDIHRIVDANIKFELRGVVAKGCSNNPASDSSVRVDEPAARSSSN